MARLPWFHMHTEARIDRKLATLSDHEFRVWFNLLCLAAEQKERGTIPPMEAHLLAVEVGCHDDDDLDAILAHLMALRIVSRVVTPGHAHVTSGHVTFTHFRDRNYEKPSDLPEHTRARKHKQRETERGHALSRDVTPIEKEKEMNSDAHAAASASALTARERMKATRAPAKEPLLPPQNTSYADLLNGALPKLESMFASVDKQFTPAWLKTTLAEAEAQVGPLSLDKLGPGLDLALSQIRRQMDAGKVTSPRPFARKLIVDFLAEQRDDHHAA